MGFFEDYFRRDPRTRESDHSGEWTVCCPFHDDNKPSAHANVDERVFHCKNPDCIGNAGMSEVQFYAKLNDCSLKQAQKYIDRVAEVEGFADSWSLCESILQQPQMAKIKAKALKVLGIREETLRKLRLGYEAERGGIISFPILVSGSLIDVRNYNPDRKTKDGKPLKIIGQKGSIHAIFPYDVWQEDTSDYTLLCAGEKDTVIARDRGFNAVCFTGGEGSWPKYFNHVWKGRKVYIAYDNDDAGKLGARKIAMLLRDAGATPYVVEGHHNVCVEKGGDIHDFFHKYGKNAKDLQAILDGTEPFTDEEYQIERDKKYPLITLQRAKGKEYLNKRVSSHITVVAVDDLEYQIPTYATVELRSKQSHDVVERKEWSLEENNIRDALFLFEKKDMDDRKVEAQIRQLAGLRISNKELNNRGLYVTVKIKSYSTLYKATIADDRREEYSVVEDKDGYDPSEVFAFSLDEKFSMKQSRSYRIDYRIVSHPYMGQALVAMVYNIQPSDNLYNFKITEGVKESLKVFQGHPKHIMSDLYQKARKLIAPEIRKEFFFSAELVFHSPLRFIYEGRGVQKGALDVMVIGDSQIGKSMTASGLQKLYNLGETISLRSATAQGLIGGTDKNHQTRPGRLAQNHQGMVVLEEFSDGGAEKIHQITEMKTSEKIDLTRVNGNLTVDCTLRMLTNSNNASSQNRTIAEYADGVDVVRELVPKPEDVARYDFFIVASKERTEIISPDTEVHETPHSQESYRNRVRWVWSRKPEQVVIDGPIKQAINDAVQELNDRYDSRKLFFLGTTAWKKVCRIALACAACCVSTDETFEKIIVKPEHVAWAKSFLIACYDNRTFKLRQRVVDERSKEEADDISHANAQTLYDKYPAIINTMRKKNELGVRQLQMISGLDQDSFSGVMRILTENNFIEWTSTQNFQMTLRFRKSCEGLKEKYLRRVGV